MNYFASKTYGESMSFRKAKSLGLVQSSEGYFENYFELQKNDANTDGFASDEETVIAALSDASRGDRYAIEQLTLAVSDPLVLDISASCVM